MFSQIVTAPAHPLATIECVRVSGLVFLEGVSSEASYARSNAAPFLLLSFHGIGHQKLRAKPGQWTRRENRRNNTSKALSSSIGRSEKLDIQANFWRSEIWPSDTRGSRSGNVVSPFMFGLGCGQDLWKRRITSGDRMSESRANEPRFPRKLGHTTGTFYWDQDDELTGLNIGFCM